MLDYDELIDHLCEKGVTFKLVSKDDAKHFLSEHNYYVKLTSYRFNYPKKQKRRVRWVGFLPS